MEYTLITGGCGSIGQNLIRKLSSSGRKILVLDNLTSGRREWLPIDVEFIVGDIRDHETLERVFGNYKINEVVHLAANFANQNSVENPSLDSEVNINGSILLLKFIVKHGIKNVVYTSSSCVYGNKSDKTNELYIGELDTPYAISKYTAEFYFKYFAETYNLSCKVLRLFNSYGPYELSGAYRNVIPNFISRALEGLPITITGSGNETRDFTFVEDTIEAIQKALEFNDTTYDVFNVGKGEPVKIIDLANKILKICESNSTITFEPRRSWDHVLHRECDNSKIKNTLNWQAKTSIDQGLKKYISWYLINQ